tara:strand:+ start:233 stop:343 length:111 start_codon:yes stop_codon:yes gene_type:complete
LAKIRSNLLLTENPPQKPEQRQQKWVFNGNAIITVI